MHRISRVDASLAYPDHARPPLHVPKHDILSIYLPSHRGNVCISYRDTLMKSQIENDLNTTSMEVDLHKKQHQLSMTNMEDYLDGRKAQ